MMENATIIEHFKDCLVSLTDKLIKSLMTQNPLTFSHLHTFMIRVYKYP